MQTTEVAEGGLALPREKSRHGFCGMGDLQTEEMELAFMVKELQAR